jgi:large subunit ribosomal protein L29
MEVKDIRKLSEEAIILKIADAENLLVDLNIQKAAGEIKNFAQISNSRKVIARFKTILNELKGVTNDSPK